MYSFYFTCPHEPIAFCYISIRACRFRALKEERDPQHTPGVFSFPLENVTLLLFPSSSELGVYLKLSVGPHFSSVGASHKRPHAKAKESLTCSVSTRQAPAVRSRSWVDLLVNAPHTNTSNLCLF